MKKEIKDPAVIQARKTKDELFEASSYFLFDRDSTVKQFGRNRVLKGQKRNKSKK
jgi:hypothetical protein